MDYSPRLDLLPVLFFFFWISFLCVGQRRAQIQLFFQMSRLLFFFTPHARHNPTSHQCGPEFPLYYTLRGITVNTDHVYILFVPPIQFIILFT